MKNRSDILELPNELISHIFSFVPSAELTKSVVLTCRKFATILLDDLYWRSRINSSEGKVRLTDCEVKRPGFSPIKSCIAIDLERERWRDWEKQRIVMAPNHLATIDALKLFKKDGRRLCLSASRDRCIALWDVDNIQNGEVTDANKWLLMAKQNAHDGWIWNIELCREGDDDQSADHLLSCGWDSQVKLWQMTPTEIIEKSRLKVESAVQQLKYRDGQEVVCSTFLKTVHFLDMRIPKPVASYRFHKGVVFGLETSGNYIYSSAEDKSLVMTDRRNLKKPLSAFVCGSHTRSMSYGEGQLVCGASNGVVYTRDPQNMLIVAQYRVGDSVRQVKHSKGAHYVLCNTKHKYKFKVLTPGTRQRLIVESEEMYYEPSKFDYSADTQTLVIGTGDSSIFFHFPANEQDDQYKDFEKLSLNSN